MSMINYEACTIRNLFQKQEMKASLLETSQRLESIMKANLWIMKIEKLKLRGIFVILRRYLMILKGCMRVIL